MAIVAVTRDKDDADFTGDKNGSAPNIIETWVYTEITRQSSTETDILYWFGWDQDGTYSDTQTFYAAIDGDTKYDQSLTNSRGPGSYIFYANTKTYSRPSYGSSWETHNARCEISGIYNGDGKSDTTSKQVDSKVEDRAGTTLGAPGGLYVSGVNSSQIAYDWNAPGSSGIGPSPSSYHVQLSRNSAFTDLVANGNIGNVTSWLATGLARATTYYFRVYANNSVGAGDWSNTIGYTTSATVPDQPATPSVYTPTSGGFTVAFSAPNNGGNGITHYDIQLSTDNFATQAAYFGNLSGSPRILTGLNPGITYKARVRAVNAVGVGAWSAASAPIRTLGGVKVWNGSAWIEGIVRCWNGTSWVVVVVRKWNGTSWIA